MAQFKFTKKHLFTMALAVMMICGLFATAAFAVITPGTYFYQYKKDANTNVWDYYPTMGTDAVISQSYDSSTHEYTVELGVMEYGNAFAGYINNLVIAGVGLTEDPAFAQYLSDAEENPPANWKDYILAYEGVTGTLTFYASSQNIPIPITTLDIEVYNANGIPFDHPEVPNAYIVLP
jgi:hypothetical protein